MRDRLKDKAYWKEAIVEFNEDLLDVQESLETKLRKADPRASIAAGSYFRTLFRNVLADYSVGKPMEEIAANARKLLCEVLPDYLAKHAPGDPLSISRPGIAWINRYFSLLVLSNPSLEEAGAFVKTFDLWDYREAPVSGKRDLICEAMIDYLGLGEGREPGTGVNWPEAYQPLWETIAPETPEEERAARLSSFLEGWYDVMAPEAAAQTGTHKQKDPTYVGYWCLEAAAAAVMRDIHDSSFRDHPHYPADFADWVRRS